MTTFKLYGIWKRLLAQWLTDECHTRRTNLTWLIVGLYLSQKVSASAIVQRWPLAVKTASLTRRLSRFLDNRAIRPAVWFRPVARQLLARAAQRQLTLIVDASKVSAGHQLVMVALAYKKRALPLAWSWVNYAKGAVPTQTQLALVKRVRGLLPNEAQVILVGDAGFSSVLVLRELEGWGWQSVHDPELLPDVLLRWQASIATGEPFDMVFPLRGADGGGGMAVGGIVGLGQDFGRRTGSAGRRGKPAAPWK